MDQRLVDVQLAKIASADVVLGVGLLRELVLVEHHHALQTVDQLVALDHETEQLCDDFAASEQTLESLHEAERVFEVDLLGVQQDELVVEPRHDEFLCQDLAQTVDGFGEKLGHCGRSLAALV